MKLNIFTKTKISNDLGIIFNQDETVIYIKNQGIVLKEPTYIAIDEKTKEIVETGEKAYQMLGKTPPSIKVICPLKNGVIADFDMAVALLNEFLKRVYQKTILKPRILMSIPSDITAIEKKAFFDCLINIGAREVFFKSSPVLSSIGAGCDVSLARGMLVCSMDFSRCDAVTVSSSQIISKNSSSASSCMFIEEIIKFLKKRHGLEVGFITASSIHQKMLSSYLTEEVANITVSGCDTSTGMPKFVTIDSLGLKEFVFPVFKKISDTIRIALDNAPIEMQKEIVEDGILLTQNGADICELDKYLKTELGVKVFFAQNLCDCLIDGIECEIQRLDEQLGEGTKYYTPEQ